jgi:hypothetical protein
LVLELGPGDASLVPPGRLGAALGARRHRTRATLTATARHSGRRWNPADLRSIEQGEEALDDEAVTAVCTLYGLAGCAPLDAPDLSVVLDRTTATDVATPAGVAMDETVLLRRATGICWLLGVTPPALSGLLEALAEALGSSQDEVVRALAAIAVDDVRDASAALAARTAVPVVGVLLGDTELGALVVVRRRRRRTSGTTTLTAAGPLGGLVARTSAPRPHVAANSAS